MNCAIIPAAGQGRRMGADRAKQFLALDGEPVLVHTLRRFDACPEIDSIVVVLPEGDVSGFLQIADKAKIRKLSRVVPGGAERQDSVARGLKTLNGKVTKIVVVHDGVRPFVTARQISDVVAKASEMGAAILGLPAVDTIKEVDGEQIVRTMDRSRIVLAQTPQAFRYDVLRAAFDKCRREGWSVTDDASVVERSGHPVAVVSGSPYNIKITRPEDLELARFIRKSGFVESE